MWHLNINDNNNTNNSAYIQEDGNTILLSAIGKLHFKGFAHIEKLSLNLSCLSFVFRVNLPHLSLSLWFIIIFLVFCRL